MVKLLIIADDFTGALDTGVQFVKRGIETLVSTAAQIDLSRIPEETQVISLDLETRHMPQRQAYEKVRDAAVFARERGIRQVYKKTDSTLRGNIGAEISALMDACQGDPVVFVPAYPAAGRTTRQGRQLVDGVPVHKTQFALDLLNPVTESFIPRIIGEQCDKKVVLADEESIRPTGKNTIYVYDAETEAQLTAIAGGLKANGFSGLLAGCAGFAGYLPEIFGLRQEDRKRPAAAGSGSMLFVCGSVNQVSIEQYRYAAAQGIDGVTLTPRQKLEQGYWNSSGGVRDIAGYTAILREKGKLMISNCATGEEAQKLALPPDMTGEDIAGHAAVLVEALVRTAGVSTLVVFGGDTAVAIMNRFSVSGVTPVAELLPGVVVSAMAACGKELTMVTKAGGFGAEDTLVKIIQRMKI